MEIEEKRMDNCQGFFDFVNKAIKEEDIIAGLRVGQQLRNNKEYLECCLKWEGDFFEFSKRVSTLCHSLLAPSLTPFSKVFIRQRPLGVVGDQSSINGGIMANKSTNGKSHEAINLAAEIEDWKKEAKENSQKPWLDHILNAFRFSTDGDYEKALNYYKKAAKLKSNEKEYLENFEQILIKMTNARQQILKNRLDFLNVQLDEITNHINDIYYKVSQGLVNIQKRSFDQSFDEIRFRKVNERIKKEQEAQARLEVLLHPLKDVIYKQGIPRRILKLLFPNCQFDDLYYLEITQAILLKLKDNPELTKALRIDLAQVGGFVTHYQPNIEMIEKFLRKEYGGGYLKLHNPLIVLKKNFTASTLFHELTHACIKNIDCFLHLNIMFTKYPYEDNPEECLAFVNQILLYRYQYPRDTFDEYIRIQAKMNISGEQIVGLGGAHVELQQKIWKFMDKVLQDEYFYNKPGFYRPSELLSLSVDLKIYIKHIKYSFYRFKTKKFKTKRIMKSFLVRFQSVIFGRIVFHLTGKVNGKYQCYYSSEASWYCLLGLKFPRINEMLVEAYNCIDKEQYSEAFEKVKAAASQFSSELDKYKYTSKADLRLVKKDGKGTYWRDKMGVSGYYEIAVEWNISIFKHLAYNIALFDLYLSRQNALNLLKSDQNVDAYELINQKLKFYQMTDRGFPSQYLQNDTMESINQRALDFISEHKRWNYK